MLKQIFILSGQYFLNLLRLFKSRIWKVRNKMTSTIKLKISPDISYTFATYGEVIGTLFANQTFIRFNKGWEHKTVEKFKEYIKPGDTVLDIGANVGMYSIYASDLVGPTGKVHAFEPSNDTHKVLTKNLELNNKTNVITHQFALSNKKQEVLLRVPDEVAGRSDAFNSIHFIEKGTAVVGESMETITLDSFVEREKISKIDFIKIDIEGAELLCLQGAEQVLEHVKPKVIVFESYEPFSKRFNYGQADIILFLHQFGYSFSQYEDWQWIAIHESVQKN